MAKRRPSVATIRAVLPPGTELSPYDPARPLLEQLPPEAREGLLRFVRALAAEQAREDHESLKRRRL